MIARKSQRARFAQVRPTTAGETVEVVSDDVPLLPAGPYEAVGGKARPFSAFKAEKLCIEWTVVVPVESQPGGTRRVVLPRYYNVRRGVGGRFHAAKHGAYRREWIAVTGRRPSRNDRLSPQVFTGVMALVEVRTVSKDREQRRLPAGAHYSVIARVVEILAGGRPVR